VRNTLAVLLLAGAVTFSQDRGHSISGFVREEGTANPISSAGLEIVASGNRAAPSHTSGLEGEFRFDGLRDGEYSITVTKRDQRVAQAPEFRASRKFVTESGEVQLMVGSSSQDIRLRRTLRVTK